MFDRIFGTYLVNKGKLSEEDLESILANHEHARVKLGVIAVSEGLMTNEQAVEVNELQAITDRRFGDIAVEKGYLSEEQVSSLLKLQGNGFLHFIQSSIDGGFFSLDEIDEELSWYQDEMGFTHTDMDNLVSGDVLREVSVFLPTEYELYGQLCGVAVRTFMRIIDSNVYVEKASLMNSMQVEQFTSQKLSGDHKVVSGFGGDGDSLLILAEPFAGESFGSVDEDALDAVAEFTNCVNGLFCSMLSGDNVSMELLPPDYYQPNVMLSGDEFCVIPVISRKQKIWFVMSINSEFLAAQADAAAEGSV